MKNKLELADIAAYLIVIVMLMWVVFPLYWMVITAFKPLDEFMTYPPTFWPTDGACPPRQDTGPP